MKNEKFIIKVIGEITPMDAFYYCLKVAQQGKVSETRGVQHHCHITTFTNGIRVHCVKRGKSERFIIWKDER